MFVQYLKQCVCVCSEDKPTWQRITFSSEELMLEVGDLACELGESLAR